MQETWELLKSGERVGILKLTSSEIELVLETDYVPIALQNRDNTKTFGTKKCLEFMQDRIPPRNYMNISETLSVVGIEEYDVVEIFKYTRGRHGSDGLEIRKLDT